MKLISSPLIKSQNPGGLGRGHWSSNSVSGQAILEYILMVVVGVTLVVSLSLAIFQPLGQFVDNLNREYIKCLLETGELPQLSSEDQNVVCFDEIPSFAALDSEGNPLPPGGGQGAGNGEQAESAANRDGETTASNGGRTVRSNYRGGGRGSSRSSSRAGSESGPGKTTVIAVNQEFEEGGGFFSSQSGSGRASVRRKKTRKVAISSLTEYDRRKVERTLEKSKSTPVSSDEGITQARKKKVLVKPPAEKKVVEELQAPVGYGHYLKIFIIIILILFIIIVFGSQAYQMSKNWGNG